MRTTTAVQRATALNISPQFLSSHFTLRHRRPSGKTEEGKYAVKINNNCFLSDPNIFLIFSPLIILMVLRLIMIILIHDQMSCMCRAWTFSNIENITNNILSFICPHTSSLSNNYIHTAPNKGLKVSEYCVLDVVARRVAQRWELTGSWTGEREPRAGPAVLCGLRGERAAQQFRLFQEAGRPRSVSWAGRPQHRQVHRYRHY